MSRFNPHFQNAPRLFEAAQEFKQRCLLEQQSLLLADTRLWIPEHFDPLIKHYVEAPDEGDRKFYEKLSDQLASCEPLDLALMTEVFWIVRLAPNIPHADKKKGFLQRVWDIKPVQAFPIDSPFLATEVLSGLGSGGQGYQTNIWAELQYGVEAFSDFVRKPRDERQHILSDPWIFASWLDGLSGGKSRQFYHALCHVLFPDSFERIFSQRHKIQAAKAHGVWEKGMEKGRVDLDRALLTAREKLELEYGQPIDHYEEPVATLVDEPDAKEVDGPAAPLPSTDENSESVTIRDDSFRRPENRILYGPPGTSKTYLLTKRRDEARNLGHDVRFVAFHPSYSYEEFVGGLRPTSSAGTGMSLEFVPGPFLQLCELAHQHPDQRFLLLIDEINRANVAKVFGELITLIEPSKRVMAGSKADSNGCWVTLPGYTNANGSPKFFGIPDNIDVVATMNTADRSIASMDIALRRRFVFEEHAPNPDAITPPMVESVDLRRLLATINDRLEYLLDRDHRIGHAYFWGIHSLAQLRTVLGQCVLPLLQEYFFEDLEKVRLALTGSAKPGPFFRQRELAANTLFRESESFAGERRYAFEVTPSESWTEADIVTLYQAPVPAASV